MKQSFKNQINMLFLSIGMFLCYSVFFQSQEETLTSEFNTESGISVGSCDVDFEIATHDLIFVFEQSFTFLTYFTGVNHFHHFSICSSPLFSIWQPPNLF